MASSKGKSELSKLTEIPGSKSSDQSLFENMMFAAVAVGISISAFATYQLRGSTNKLNNKNYLNSVSSGYLIAASAIFILVPFMLKDLNKSPDSFIQKILGSFKKIIISPLPYTLTIGVLVYASVINFLYVDRLTNHHVANEYFTWASTFSFLLIVQIFLLYQYFKSKTAGLPSPLRYIIYLLSVFNAITLGIMQTILKFFSTDG